MDARRVARGGRRWRRPSHLLAFVFMFLAACGTQDAGLDATSILVKDSQSAEQATQLQSQTVDGEIYILVDTRPAPTEVAFFLDDEERVGAPLKVDQEAPFDLTLDTTTLEDGKHVVSAFITRVKGQKVTTDVHRAEFTVDNVTESGTDDGSGDGSGDGAQPIGSAPTSPEGALLSLRADPNFSESQLNDEARKWYRRVWAAIEHPDAVYHLHSLAGSGNLRNYGYDFNQQMTMVLTALRATGDPRLADLVASLSDRMADSLVTKWYDPSDGSWYEPTDGTEGYRRFLYLRSGSYNGLDTHVLSSVLSHGMIANMAYALEANRGVTSPTGVDYGAKADFWKDYLKNDFEAIWRIRSGADWPDMSLWTHNAAHSFKSQMRWGYYMYRLTGEQPYLDYAVGHVETVMENTFEVDTPLGSALVWSHRLIKPDYGLQPIAYSRYEYGIETDIALDGGLPGIDANYMAMHARTLAHFVLDNGSTDLAFDVGGMSDQRGVALRGGAVMTVPTRDPWTGSGLEYARETINRYAISYYAPLAYFAEGERIAEISLGIYDQRESDLNNPRRLAIPVGMLLKTR